MALSIKEKESLDLIQDYENSKEAPAFPVTPLKRIEVTGYNNVWVKDESFNPTGTHKDRMAWEIVSIYKEILLNKQTTEIEAIPQFSIISAGSAAFAIQTQLKKFNLPNLKVLLDQKTDVNLTTSLEAIGCEVYTVNFDDSLLLSKDILRLTNNISGFDITSNKAFSPDSQFYDWLSYEVLNENPAYVFIPYGTGQLFENIVNVNKKIVKGEKVSDVFSGNPKMLKDCNFIGATTYNSASKAVKLYAPFRPFTTSPNEWVTLHHMRGFCGRDSQISEIQEKSLEEAIIILADNNIQAEDSAAAGLAAFLEYKNNIGSDEKIIIVSTGKSKCSQ